MNLPDKSEASPPIPLPSEVYLSQDWFTREQRTLFARTWLFAGLESELPAPGDYLTMDAGVTPLVVLRDGDTLRAHHNVCRHRGAKLLEGRGNAKGISCFYHRWHYELNGRLRGLPEPARFPPATRQLTLHPASVAVWNGLIFVNADPNPPPLLDWLGEAADVIGTWPVASLRPMGSERRVMAANWKLFVENHIDGYHLAYLHKTSVRGLDHRRQSSRAIGPHWLFYEPPIEDGQSRDADQTGLPLIPGIGSDRSGSTVWHVFPTFAGAAGQTFFAILNILPLAPDRTAIETRVFTADTSWSRLAMAGVRSWLQERRHGSFVEEDIRAVEAIQKGIASGSWDGGFCAAELEDAIGRFRGSVARMVFEQSSAPIQSSDTPSDCSAINHGSVS